LASTPSRLDAVINLAKRRGFVFPCGEIYGGTRSAWDYGPLGVELKENIKRQWWQYMVRSRDDVVGLDSSVILPRETWVASGHVGAFTDPLVESLHTHKRYRADQLIEDYAARKGLDPENVTLDMVPDPVTGQPGSWTEPREFSGLLKTYLGPVDDESGLHYLRPETAQGIFINFANVMSAARKKPPFGIGQVGKSFRNEITPGNFIFRTREFEQMELEFFCEPGTDEEWHQYWIDYRKAWYTDLGISEDNLRLYEHPAEKLSHYSKRTVDLEYRFGFEPSAGLTRSLMAFLVEAYTEDEAPNTKGGVDKRIVLKLDARIAPVKAAVLPLSRKEELTGPAKELAARLRRSWNVDYDDAGAVGRRYRRQDEVGTPFCLTYDFDSPEDGAVTVRERDTMTQERIPLEGVERYLAERLIGC